MQISNTLALALAAATVSAVPLPSAGGGGIFGIIGNLLPALLGTLEQLNPLNALGNSQSMGLSVSPGGEKMTKGNSTSQIGNSTQAINIIMKLSNGAKALAKEAHLDDVVDILDQVQPALASAQLNQTHSPLL
ncbi:hypothetical protein OXX59_001279 [Metschnikowia pulcherrima]